MRGLRAGAIAFALAAASCSKGGAAPPQGRPPPLVRVTKIEVRDVPIEVRAPVDLRPIEQADVGSKLLGYVDAVLVDRGDHVKRGQVIALVRPSDLPDQLLAARGTLSQTQAGVALAQASSDRAKRLAPSGVVSQAEVDASSAQLASAKAVEASAKAQIAALGVRLGEARIESPMSGVVMMRRLDPGALVGTLAGSVIVTIARTDVLRVFITVNERDAQSLSLGQPSVIEVDALPGRRFLGKVVRLSPAFDATTRTLEAEVQLANESGELRPGMYGRGAIELARHPHVPVIPAEALLISDQKKYVFVIEGEKAIRRSVELGYDGGDWLEIAKGLTGTEDVVVAGAEGLSDGVEVRVARAEAPVSTASAAPPASAAPRRD